MTGYRLLLQQSACPQLDPLVLRTEVRFGAAGSRNERL